MRESEGPPGDIPGLVGRHDELAVVERLVDDVAANGLRFLLVEGNGGIGKSRLISEGLERAAARRPVTVVSARAPRDNQTPFGAAYRLLPGILGREAGAALGRELVGLAGAGGLVGAPDAQAERLRRMSEVATAMVDGLVALSATSLLAVVLDDIQWFDPSSHELMALVADRLADHHAQARILSIGVTRPPTTSTTLGELHRVLAASARCRRLHVNPLDEAAEADLVHSVAPDASVSYVELVRRSSRGNPLQSLAAVSVLERRGIPHDIAAGDKRIVQGAAIALPHTAGADDEPLRALLLQLPAAEAEALGRLALFASEFSVADAAALTGQPRAELAAALDRAVAADLLDTDTTTYWFAHDRLAEAAAAHLPPSHQADAHRRSAHRLAELRDLGSAGLEVEIARHYLLSGADLADADAELRAMTDAGAACLAAGAWEDAGRYFERALTSSVDHDRRRLDLLLQAGTAHYYRQDVHSAPRRLEEAIALARNLGDHDTWCRAGIMLVRLRLRVQMTGTTDRALMAPLLDLLDAEPEPGLRAQALVTIAEAQTTGGDLEAARASSELAIEAAESGTNTAVQALASFARGFASVTGNEVADAERSLRRALELGRVAGDPHLEANLQLRLAFALLGSGHLAESQRLADSSLTIGRSRNDHVIMALAFGLAAQLAWLRGDFDEVERLAERSAASTRRSGYRLAAFFHLSARFLARLASGQIDEAHALVAANADGWALASRLGAVTEAARGEPPPVDVNRRTPTATTQLRAAMVAVATQVAVAQRDHRALAELEPELARLQDRGAWFLDLYPVFIPRLRAEALEALGQLDPAARCLGPAMAPLAASGAAAEEVPAFVALARIEMARPGGSADQARAAAVQAVQQAERLGMESPARQAAALLRLGIDRPEHVSARSGRWRVILVTDVVGSSRVSAEIGDIAYYHLIMRHHELVRANLDRFGGHEFSESGDGLLAWFDSTEQAARASLAILDSITAAQPGGPQLAVKVGLAGGEPLFHDGRPYGLVVNRAARLVGLAAGGQILCDEAVAGSLPADVQGVPGPTVSLRNMGEHRIVEIRRPR